MRARQILPTALVPGMFRLLPTVGLAFPDGYMPGHRWRRPIGVTVALPVIAVVQQTIAPADVWIREGRR